MLDINSLSVAYGQHQVLFRISLDVHAGEIVAIIGPNGAGKSTLLRATSGVIPLKSGYIRVNGLDLGKLNPTQRARLLAVVPQARSLPPAFTVYETVLLGRTPHLGWLGNSSPEDHQQTRLALESAQVQDLAERRVGELSGGEQQRVLLARALAQDTPVLLLDEPTTHLDLHHQSGILNLVQDFASYKRIAVLMVLHDLNLASLYAQRVALMVQGRIHAIGTPKEVLTVQNLSAMYNIPINIISHPEYDTPLVLPDGRNGGK